jgi:hypothetical protein
MPKMIVYTVFIDPSIALIKGCCLRNRNLVSANSGRFALLVREMPLDPINTLPHVFWATASQIERHYQTSFAE